MNRAWHEQHRMPKSATLDERISWHRSPSPVTSEPVDGKRLALHALSDWGDRLCAEVDL